MRLDFANLVWGTSVLAEDGKFHPAVQTHRGIKFWPNVKFATETEAFQRACLAIADAEKAANEIAKNWNVVKL